MAAVAHSASMVESSWNVMAHGDAREGKWTRNWRMELVFSTLHTTSKHGVSSITTAYAHTSAASSRLNWRPCRFKWTRPFRRKTKSGFCACAITFQTQSSTFWWRHALCWYGFCACAITFQTQSSTFWWRHTLCCYSYSLIHPLGGKCASSVIHFR
jgi:hypothetical protein